MIAKTYKTKIYPSREQERILLRWGNALRGIWNHTVRESEREWLEAQRDHEAEGRWADDGGPSGPPILTGGPPGKPDLRAKARIAGLYERSRTGPEWMREVPGTMRSQAANHMDSAWQGWHRTGRKPALHKRGSRLSMSAQGVRFSGHSSIVLPISSALTPAEKATMREPVRLAEPIGERLKAGRPGRGPRKKGARISPARAPGWKGVGGDVATLSYEAGAWYASFPADEHHPPAPREEQLAARGKTKVDVLGVDARTDAYVCSDGTIYELPACMSRLAESIELAQRTLSGRKQGSKRWRRAKEILAKRSAKLARVRETWLDRISYDLSTRARVVVVEDIRWSELERSARGTILNPGKDVQRKANLNRRLLNAAARMFRDKLAYKCSWYGARFVVVDPQYTSQDCSSCGLRARQPVEQRTYACHKCGLVIDRRLNAAKNIRDRFLRGNTEEGPGASGPTDDTGGCVGVAHQASINGGDTNAGVARSARKGTVTPTRWKSTDRPKRGQAEEITQGEIKPMETRSPGAARSAKRRAGAKKKPRSSFCTQGQGSTTRDGS